jgi:hypothetical protein
MNNGENLGIDLVISIEAEAVHITTSFSLISSWFLGDE